MMVSCCGHSWQLIRSMLLFFFLSLFFAAFVMYYVVITVVVLSGETLFFLCYRDKPCQANDVAQIDRRQTSLPRHRRET